MTALVDNYCNYDQTKSACIKYDADESTGLKTGAGRNLSSTQGENIKILKYQNIRRYGM